MGFNMEINFKGDKGFRLLYIYEQLNKGALIKTKPLSTQLCVSEKTIHRDINALRVYLTEVHQTESKAAIIYDKKLNGYVLVEFEREWLTNEEVLAICKILLESRAFCKEELDILITKLISQVSPIDEKRVNDIIREEKHHYIPLKHNKELLSLIWQLTEYITTYKIIKFDYKRQDGKISKKEVIPVSIMFSEFYFYLLAYDVDNSKKYPTIFRIDRIENLKDTKIKFNNSKYNQFNDGEFRKRVQFMYAGELKTIRFKFSGPSLEAILDKLPTAKIIDDKDNPKGTYTIEAQTYGDGVDMWLKTQGDWIKYI